MGYSSADMLALSCEAAKEHYIDLAYHNWEGHIEPMLDFAGNEIKVLRSLGVTVSRQIVEDATYWHDANFHKDHQALGFISKEEYSAWLAANFLSDIGRDDDYIASVVDGIRATEIGKPRTNNESTLVVAADLHNLSGSSNYCLLNTIRIAREQLQLGKVLPRDSAEFCITSARFIGQYFTEPLVYLADDGTLIERGGYMQEVAKNLVNLGRVGIEHLLMIPGAASLIPEVWLPK